MPGEGAAPKLCATKPHLKALKLPDSCEDPLDKARGVGLRPVHTARKAGMEAVESLAIEVIKPKGVLLDANATPAPPRAPPVSNLQAGLRKPLSHKSEALEPWAERGVEQARDAATVVAAGAQIEGMCSCGLEALLQSLQGYLSRGKRRPKQALQDAASRCAGCAVADSCCVACCRGCLCHATCGVGHSHWSSPVWCHSHGHRHHVVMFSWPHHHHAIGACRLDCKESKLVEKR
jgi:hypothetical protein